MALRWIVIALALLTTGSTIAGVSCSVPNTLTNGTVADANQVMANFNAIINCLSNAAKVGANNDITSMSGLTTPISPAQGGSTVFIATAIAISGNNVGITSTAPPGFTNTAGYSVLALAPIANTGPVTISVDGQPTKNIFKTSSSGPTALTGGEIVTNQGVQIFYDGTQFELISTHN